MKKIIGLIFLANLMYGNMFLGTEKMDEKLYGSDTVNYYCVDNNVIANINLENGSIKKIPVVWEKNNTVVRLNCKDFNTWINEEK